jgi:citrate lyase subunit beta-like protein
MLAKSLTLTSDNITYDLEDSVTPAMKATARVSLRDHLASLPSKPPSIGELSVRINAVSSPHALEDLTTLASLPTLDTIVVPKVNSASDLSFVTDVLRHRAPHRHPLSAAATDSTPTAPPPPGTAHHRPINLIALIESARAVMDLRSICGASPYLRGLVFAAEDFAMDMSLTRTPGLGEFLYARSAIATAARAFELPSTIDLVCTSFRGAEGVNRLEDECRNGREMGFNGKRESASFAIHFF